MNTRPGDQLKCYFTPSQHSPAASWRQLSKTPMSLSAAAWVTSKVWKFFLINFCEQLNSVITSGLTPSDLVRCCRKCRLLCSLQGGMGKWKGKREDHFHWWVLLFPEDWLTSCHSHFHKRTAVAGSCSCWTLLQMDSGYTYLVFHC